MEKEGTYILADYFGMRQKRGHIGIEIEVECRKPPPPPSGWLAHHEGSLRGNSLEYVTDRPIKESDNKIKFISSLTDILNNDREVGADKNSIRTSVHIHCNVLSMTPLQIWTASCAYWLVENVLMEYCGKHRIGNRFCLRAIDAEGIIKNAVTDVSGHSVFSTFREQDRYAALNLNALTKFGSMEFRGMRGTLNAYCIDKWSSVLWGLIQNSKKFSSPEDLLKSCMSKGADFIWNELILPGFSPVEDRNIRRKMIEDNVGLLLELAFCVDWGEWEKKKQKEIFDRSFKHKNLEFVLQQVVNEMPDQGRQWRVEPLIRAINEEGNA